MEYQLQPYAPHELAAGPEWVAGPPHGLRLARVVRRRYAVGGIIFLLLAPALVGWAVWSFQPRYMAEAIVQVNSIRPRVLYKTDDSSSGATFSTFFNTQVATLTSNALLNRCLNDPTVSGSVVVEGSQDPLGALREAVDVSVVQGTQYLAVRIRGKKPQGLAAVANTIVRMYLTYLDEADSMSQNRKIQLLDAERKKLSLDVQTKTAALAQLRASTAGDPDTSSGLLIRDPLSVTHEALVDIRRNQASLKAKIDSLGAALKAQDIQVPSSIVNAALEREPEVEPLAALLAQLRREIALAESEAASPAVAAVQARLNAEPQIGALKHEIARRELHLARLSQGPQAMPSSPKKEKEGQGDSDPSVLAEALSDNPEAKRLVELAMGLRQELVLIQAHGGVPPAATVRERLDAQPQIRALREEITRKEVELAAKSETLNERHHTIWYMKATLDGMRSRLAKAEVELKDKVSAELKQETQQREKELRAQLLSVEEQLMPYCERALKQTRGTLAALRERLATLEPELKTQAVQDVKKDAERRVGELRTQLTAVEKQVQQSREQGRAKVVARLKEEGRANMARQLKDLESELVACNTSDIALRAMLGKQVEQRALAERKGAELKSLEDDLGRARQSLLGVEQRLHELEVEAGAPGYVSIASMASDPKLPEPYADKRVKYGIVAVIGAAGLALLVMVLLDRRDDRIRAPEDLQELAGAELLGCVPHWGKEVLVAGAEPALLCQPGVSAPALVAEEIRNLMVRILSPADDQPVRTVLVTSVAPGDGKTTLSANLAACIASLGKKVVLVDASFRKPDVARLFGLDGGPGLGDALLNGHVLSEVIRSTPISGLSVIPAGSIPPDTVGVLGSSAMRDLLAELSSRYDHILLDGPPLMFADARILAPQVDGVVCSLRAVSSRRVTAHECLATLRRLGARVLGMVLVGVRPEHNGYAATVAALRSYGRPPRAPRRLLAGEGTPASTGDAQAKGKG